MIYLDSCALVKLVLVEAETTALQAFLSARANERHVTSALALTELPRAIIQAGGDADLLEEADRLLARFFRIRLQDETLHAAGRHAGINLRSLDAIHLVTAQSLGEALTALITYDKRLHAAAAAAALPVHAPA